MFDWLLALAGVTVETLPRKAIAEVELYALAPGALVTAWCLDEFNTMSGASSEGAKGRR